MAGCAGSESARLRTAKAAEADANQSQKALDTAKQINQPALPDLPGDCTGQERAGAAKQDGLDVAVVKYDRALGRANDRVRRCADWYGEVKGARQ